MISTRSVPVTVKADAQGPDAFLGTQLFRQTGYSHLRTYAPSPHYKSVFRAKRPIPYRHSSCRLCSVDGGLHWPGYMFRVPCCMNDHLSVIFQTEAMRIMQTSNMGD